MKVKPLTHPCGCKSIGPRWLELCPPCKQLNDDTRARWAAERAAGNTSGEFIHTRSQST